jgi:hypothetical protein
MNANAPSRFLGSARRASLSLLLLFGACAPSMDPASLVEKTRVIGARVEVEGAPERAMPRPGERAHVRWLVTAPAEMPPIGWTFALCTGPSSAATGCGHEPLGVMQGHEAQPAMDITVPPAEALGDARVLVLFGRVCSNSEPMIDAAGRPACTMNGDGTTAVLTIPLAMAAGDDNHNPALAGEAMTVDGQPWALDDHADCAGLPHVMAGTVDHLLRVETAAGDRERYTEMMGDPPVPTERREALQISQFSTAGKLARTFSTVEAADPGDRPTVEVKWKAPAADQVPAAGLVVRFTFVARDLRGGADWTTRAVCVIR